MSYQEKSEISPWNQKYHNQESCGNNGTKIEQKRELKEQILEEQKQASKTIWDASHRQKSHSGKQQQN